MKTLSLPELDAILESIREYLAENKRISKALNSIADTEISFNCGGKLLDSMIDLVANIFDDKDGIFEWYVFENDFGKKKLARNVKGKEMMIGSSEELLEALKSKK